jgi:hypothetical protein
MWVGGMTGGAINIPVRRGVDMLLIDIERYLSTLCVSLEKTAVAVATKTTVFVQR